MSGLQDSDLGVDTVKADYSFFRTTKFKICFLAMCINVLTFGLDAFIIVVAVPRIVSQFDSLDKVEWLNTAFFIPCAGCILIYSQIMTVFSPKWIYLGAVVVFEIGSAICGAAQSMNMLIVGRAVAGLGGAGLWNASYLIGGELIPFEKRAGYFSLFGVSFIVASVMGPLVGGAFTDIGAEGWRWCFYINLPIGGVALALLALTLPKVRLFPRYDGKPDGRSRFVRLLTLDWVSTLFTIGFVTCLGIGTQWGGVTKAWNDVGVVVNLALAGAFVILIIGWSLFLGDKAMLPPSLLRRRHISAGAWANFFAFGAVVVYLYYLPLHFEAIDGKSAVRAGVLLLGVQLSMSPFLIIAGKLAERTGIAKYTVVVGGGLIAVASGLLTTISPGSGLTKIIVFEVISGIGFGCALNIIVVLVQADYLSEPHMIPHATNTINFAGFLGRIVAMNTATSVFQNKLGQGLKGLTDLPVSLIAEISAAPESIWSAIPDSVRPAVLDIYSKSINNVWWYCLASGCMCILSALLMRNLNIKEIGLAAAKARELADSPTYAMETKREVGIEESAGSSKTDLKD
ncbi:hypothetical protein M231_05584 [Tremella mesenterica]|uniref:Major facilitator superfamily (MFS) profile domain-containing protein n=1 Tax=Tremella mesenterica TaxID=5217 RepID=A0A4Q1BHP8_TREME|nr:hypothetical protein M231_05584 [Tremella mesenterica]